MEQKNPSIEKNIQDALFELLIIIGMMRNKL